LKKLIYICLPDAPFKDLFTVVYNGQVHLKATRASILAGDFNNAVHLVIHSQHNHIYFWNSNFKLLQSMWSSPNMTYLYISNKIRMLANNNGYS
jgi:hypothetical protein